MENEIRNLAVGDMMTWEKYQFIDSKIIANVIDDFIALTEREQKNKKSNEAYIKYRKEDGKFELHDPNTNKSYWLESNECCEDGDIKLSGVTNYD